MAGIHQADLYARRDDDSIRSWGSVELYLEGECDLADGLAIGGDAIDGLRRQAVALLKMGKWQRAIDVMLGVSALGSVHPGDALVIERCERGLGNAASAQRARAVAERLMRALGAGESAIDQVPPIALSEARGSWEEARRLASAVESLNAFMGRRRGDLSDPEAVSIALASAGMCEAVAKFPAGQLALLRARATKLGRPARTPLLRRGEGLEAAPALARIAGEPELESQLRGQPYLDAFAVMFDQASSAPDYSMTRIGEFHPESREDYRRRRHGSMSLYLSEGRHEQSHAEAHRIARALATGEPPEPLLIAGFMGELDVHAGILIVVAAAARRRAAGHRRRGALPAARAGDHGSRHGGRGSGGRTGLLSRGGERDS